MRGGKNHHSSRKSLSVAFTRLWNMIAARRVSNYATLLFNHDIDVLEDMFENVGRWMDKQIEKVDRVYKEREIYRNALCEIATLADNWKGNPMGVVANKALAKVGDVRDRENKS